MTDDLKYDPDSDRVIGGQAYSPLSVCFEPTNECPARCPYCLIEHHRRNIAPAITMDALHAVLDAGVRRVGFGGGEPLVAENIVTMGEQTRRRGAGALLRTSGMYEIDSAFVGAFDWFDFSLDTTNPSAFRRARPGVDLDTLLSNIVRLSELGARVRVSVLLTSINQSTAEDTVLWLRDVAKVREVRIQRLVHRGRAVRTGKRLELGPTTLAETTNRLLGLGNGECHVRTLGSVASQTLCVVKPDGDLFYATENGLIQVGSVFADTWWDAIPEATHRGQADAYLG